VTFSIFFVAGAGTQQAFRHLSQQSWHGCCGDPWPIVAGSGGTAEAIGASAPCTMHAAIRTAILNTDKTLIFIGLAFP
jgi:hypothetical protein